MRGTLEGENARKEVKDNINNQSGTGACADIRWTEATSDTVASGIDSASLATVAEEK